ncbi:tyrosine-protein kinase Drl-like [Sitophilus oryzae]|uniref:Tyrosine-protein kinase Drl-like n=1 Tax=Sitophilus oryzae TaxID=7048 RepID=A0A6J2XXW7_SITOR|nr:tyrosine-protein kinase Drl-like [Sitophilus oryzae]
MWLRLLILSLFSFTFILFKSDMTSAHLNFFITEEEMSRLLGINTELYYVNKGVVNDYAINFVVLVPKDVDTIKFSWQSLLNYSLPYILEVKYGPGNKGVLLPPQMNVSSNGVIPTSVQTFRITMMCTGLKTAEITVFISLFVSTREKSNTTIVKFKRNKVCYKGIGNLQNDSIRLDPSYFGSLSDFAVACVLTLITLALFVVITSAYYIKRKKQDQEHTYMTALYDSNPHMFLRQGFGRPPSTESGSYATIDDLQKNPPSPVPYATSDCCRYSENNSNYRVSYYASSQVMLISQVSVNDPRLIDPTKRLRTLAVPRETISIDNVKEEGIFGKVCVGKYQEKTVFIKTTKDTVSKRLLNLFLAEGTMMFGMDHKNVLTVLCVNLDNPTKPLLVYSYASRGNLKRFLINCRQRKDNTTISTQVLVDMAIQILLGLMYLHSKNICYKDMAARNAVVGEKFDIKITDNCLSRDLFPNDYFCMGDKENKPVKWMALESLIYDQWTFQTDVWSFGVVLWELTTLCQQPYADIDPYEMSTHLRTGYRLTQPIGCPDELYAVMTYCWLNNPADRPQLNQLLAYLNEFFTALCRFV